MDALVQQSLRPAEEKEEFTAPWMADEPCIQPYYEYDGSQWVAREAKLISASPSGITKLALYSWNIDFMLPFPDSRMKAALAYLHDRVVRSEDTALAIYLQECVYSDLKLIADQPWIQQNFFLTDIDTSNWQSGHYGTITLIDRRLPLTSTFRVHYSATRMQRDVLITDLILQNRIVRLCNSHLESLALEPPFRIPQMKLIASYMHAESIDFAIAAGDFNAIQPFDKTLHIDNNLLDAYLEKGGDEDDAAAGHTWGQQAATFQRERFGTTRMDKVYFTPAPQDGLRLLSFERFGAGVVVQDPMEAEEICNSGFEQAWVTDHLGVQAVFEVSCLGEGQRSSI